jgi:hypothetical protein
MKKMKDDTEPVRRAMIGDRWDTQELQRDFEVIGFLAPYVVVRRRVDGVRGTMEFTHSPRWYFGFKEVGG